MSAARWRPAGTAAELRRLARDTVQGGAARHALWLRLATLPQAWSKPHHLRLARAALDPLLRADRAQLFALADGDLVAVWRGPAEALVDSCRAALRTLFADAEIADPARLVETMMLPTDTGALLEALDRSERAAPDTAPSSAPLPALDTRLLARMEERLASADVARFARRHDVCAITPRERFALRWEQRVLSLDELGATLAPACDLRADPWLLRRLTRTLDQRLLALLAFGGELDGAGPFALDLNVLSILAPEFLRFDAALPATLRGRIVLGLAPADILADTAGFRFARDFSRARQYRLALVDVSAELLPVLAGAAREFDLLRLRWSPALAGQALPPLPAQVVLAQGVSLFQGARVARGRAVPFAATEDGGARPSRNLALGGVVTAA